MIKVLGIFVLLPSFCFSQITISGKIIDEVQRKPVASASVFLSNATVGSKTNDDGTFTLRNVKPGKYHLVVSIIGYETINRDVTVVNGDLELPDIELNPKAILLNEVNIKPVTDHFRERNYQWFKNEFLGTSAMAADCRILNPEVLDLNYNDQTHLLTAWSQEFLEIENDALGYKIKYLLTGFKKDSKIENASTVSYQGYALFEEMDSKPAQIQKWLKRRKNIYEGSLMHFLRSSLRNTIAEEGFTVLQLAHERNPQRMANELINAQIAHFKKLKTVNGRYHDSLSFWESQLRLPEVEETLSHYPLNQEDIIRKTDQKGIFALGCNTDELRVTYHKAAVNTPGSFIKHPEDDLNQLTVIEFNKPYALFDSNGGLLDPASITLKGEWGKKRIAELLPVDYQPGSWLPDKQNDNKIVDRTNLPDKNTVLHTGLSKLIALSDSAIKKQSPEHLYLQFDKPYYAIGDTMWYKAYLLNSASLTASGKSGILYIDLANDSNKVIRRHRILVQNGTGWGNIGLNDKEFTTGAYHIKAYTQWMRNQGADYFFNKRFEVSGAPENFLLVDAKFKEILANGERKLTAKLLFNDREKIPYAVKPLQIQLLDGSRHIFKQIAQTGIDGSLNVNFNLPTKPGHLSIVVENEQQRQRTIIPVMLEHPENTDVQFLPEGGNLVAGLKTHIGFKAVGENGRGGYISGIIINKEQQQIAAFSALHNGIGSFELAVKAGEIYIAKVNLPGGPTKLYPLPAVKNSGTVLQVVNKAGLDSVQITAAIAGERDKTDQSYFLVGKARGIVFYAAIITFGKENTVKRTIAKSLFPSGITHFTLMTIGRQPLNERLVFINHQDNLQIQLTAGKPEFKTRDSATVKIKVTDTNGSSVAGNFSVAVTDDDQVKTDSLNENIISRMLLTADLKGYVEQPGYYLQNTSQSYQALDDLLLTQGWIGYHWKEVFDPPAIIYQPEKDFRVTGSVVNVFNKLVKGTHVLLFSKSPAILMDTITDNGGRFVYNIFPRVDTPVFVLTAVNKNGKSFNVNIKVDEIAPPISVEPPEPVSLPWYVNSDTTLLSFTKNKALARRLEAEGYGGHTLKEVKIRAKKIVTVSSDFKGLATTVLTEKDLEKAEKKKHFPGVGGKCERLS